MKGGPRILLQGRGVKGACSSVSYLADLAIDHAYVSRGNLFSGCKYTSEVWAFTGLCFLEHIHGSSCRERFRGCLNYVRPISSPSCMEEAGRHRSAVSTLPSVLRAWPRFALPRTPGVEHDMSHPLSPPRAPTQGFERTELGASRRCHLRRVGFRPETPGRRAACP